MRNSVTGDSNRVAGFEEKVVEENLLAAIHRKTLAPYGSSASCQNLEVLCRKEDVDRELAGLN